MNCNNWIKQNQEDIVTELNECPLCSSIRNFSYKRLEYIWKWDISIPQDCQYGDWDSIELYLVRVPLPIIRCETCGEYLRLEPAFILKGTILTINALIFSSFVYEKENFTWRRIVDTLCKGNHKLSHSTIYTAVHKLSKIDLSDSLNANIPVNHNAPALWPPLKARFAHTKEREEKIRLVLTIMIVLLPYYKSFLDLLIKFTDILKSSQSSQISRLLPLYRSKLNVNTS
jgi:hypothetical protein